MPATYQDKDGNIVYQAKNFQTGLTVTCFIWDKDLVKSSLLTFTELEFGLYFLNFNFETYGLWHSIFFENGEVEEYHVFRVVTEMS